jgi:hypothetical protein
MLILGHRCPLFLAIRSFHGCSMGATPSRSAQGVCRAAAVAGAASTCSSSAVHLAWPVHDYGRAALQAMHRHEASGSGRAGRPAACAARSTSQARATTRPGRWMTGA